MSQGACPTPSNSTTVCFRPAPRHLIGGFLEQHSPTARRAARAWGSGSCRRWAKDRCPIKTRCRKRRRNRGVAHVGDDGGIVSENTSEPSAFADRAMMRHMAPLLVAEGTELGAGLPKVRLDVLELRKLGVQPLLRLLHAHQRRPRNKRADIVQNEPPDWRPASPPASCR